MVCFSMKFWLAMSASGGRKDLQKGQMRRPLHCLFRDPDNKEKLSGHNSQSAWLVAVTQAHFEQYETTITDFLWLGARDETFPEQIKSENEMMLSTRTPTIESERLIGSREWLHDDTRVKAAR